MSGGEKSKRLDKVLSELKKIFCIKVFSIGPVSSVIVVLGSVLLAIMLSASLADIQRASPVSWLRGEGNFNGVIVWEALLFWMLFAIIAITASLREYHTYYDAKNHKKELKDNIESVREIARTMPPKDYLEKYSEAFFYSSFNADNIYSTTLSSILEKNNPENNRFSLNETIRVVLDAMINLALIYDTPHYQKNVKYIANIMWVRSPNDPRDQEVRKELWKSAAKLSSFNNYLAFFASVDLLLVLDQNLATNSNNVGKPELDILEPLCLGHCIGKKGEGFNLPGPPESLAKGYYSHVQDSREIADTLKEYGDRERENVRRYYSREDRERSIISMPIMGYDPSTGAKEPSIIAVVSVYRNFPGIMKDDQRAYMFYHQMSPFLSVLYRLCWIRYKLDELAKGSITEYTKVCDPTPEKKEQVWKFIKLLKIKALKPSKP